MLPFANIIECHEARFILFNSNDAISNVLYRTGRWDEFLLSISRFFIESIDAPIVLDIGANLGAYSIPIAKSIQDKGGLVYAFEPQRIVYYQLCGNVVLNRLENIEAHNIAIGAFNGDVSMPSIDYTKNHNVGAFSLNKELRVELGVEQYSNYEKLNKVKMMTLDSFQIDRPPSLIKIDVEGYELDVLMGSINFLKSNSFPPIIFEAWNETWFDENRMKLISFIHEIGYEISLNIGAEYVAQHPENPVKIAFQKHENGTINMIRLR